VPGVEPLTGGSFAGQNCRLLPPREPPAALRSTLPQCSTGSKAIGRKNFPAHPSPSFLATVRILAITAGAADVRHSARTAPRINSRAIMEWRDHDGAFVSPDAEVAEGVNVSPGAVIHARVRVGAGTAIGSAVVIHPGSVLGQRCVVEDGAVLGKRPRLRKGSSAAGAPIGALEVGDDVTICCGAIVYAGAKLGQGVIIGDQAQVRERAIVGERSVIGRGSCVDFGASVGARVLIQTAVYVTGGSVVEDDVFIGPGVVTTNDNAMGRHPKDAPLEGPIFRRACRVGGGAVLVPGVEIGQEAFVAAGALVTKDVAARDVVRGLPAQVCRSVEEHDLIERWR
jgi:UDP-3-O-[3-hydroxymyristoyl] glucosamine N-acyltransferase